MSSTSVASALCVFDSVSDRARYISARLRHFCRSIISSITNNHCAVIVTHGQYQCQQVQSSYRIMKDCFVLVGIIHQFKQGSKQGSFVRLALIWSLSFCYANPVRNALFCHKVRLKPNRWRSCAASPLRNGLRYGIRIHCIHTRIGSSRKRPFLVLIALRDTKVCLCALHPAIGCFKTGTWGVKVRTLVQKAKRTLEAHLLTETQTEGLTGYQRM